MTERISGDKLYVTHKEMNAQLWKMLGGAAAMVISVIGGTWFLNDRIRNGHDDLKDKINVVSQDVAVIKVELTQLTKLSAIETHDTNQAQYVLVALPHGDAELKDQRIRDILKQQKLIRGD